MSDHINPPNEELNGSRRRRGLTGFIAAAAVTLIAAPAALAAVWSVNEVQSEYTLTNCLTKADGQDSTDFGGAVTDYYIDFDELNTRADPVTGAAVLQEQLTVRAPAGFRTYSTDTFRLNAAGCGYNFNVQLRAAATNSFGDPVTDAAWGDLGVRIYLSEVAAPGTDFSNAADWDQSPLTVDNAGNVVVAATGQAMLTDGSNLMVGFQLDGGATVADAGTLNFQVEFSPIP